MEKLSFSLKNKYNYETGIVLPIPDGYRCICGEGVNAGWCCIVPESFPVGGNHIDAKPFSFGVTLNPIIEIPESIMGEDIKTKVDIIVNLFVSRGVIDQSVEIRKTISSANCAFIFQNWINEDDKTFNKTNGFVIAGKNLYQFHAFANHNEEISCDDRTIEEFLKTVNEWMKNVSIENDEPAKEEEPEKDENQFNVEHLQVIFEQICSLINKANFISNKDMTIKNMKSIIMATGSLFYKAKNAELDDEAVSVISKVTGEFEGKVVNKATIDKVSRSLGARTPTELMSSFGNRNAVGSLVTIDKAIKSEFKSGCTSLYIFVITGLLFVLCEKLGVEFGSDQFCEEALSSLSNLIQEKWSSTMVF